MKHTKIRRVLTFIFTLTFITSTVMGTLPAFSLNADKTDLVEIKNESFYIGAGKVGKTVNVLEGINPYINEYVAPAGTIAAEDKSMSDAGGNPVKLTDGNYETEYFNSSCKFHNDQGWIFDGSVYNKLAFDLGKATDITGIMVAHSTTKGLTTGEYKVYVSSEKDTLFETANLVADVENTATCNQNVITTKSGETLNGQYLGIVVNKPGYDPESYSSDKTIAYTRIKEIAVYAADTSSKTPRATVSDISDSTELPAIDAANGEFNLTSGVVGKYYSNEMGDGIDIDLKTSSSKMLLLTDGDVSGDTEAKCFTGYDFRFGVRDASIYFNERASVALTYDLGATFELTKFTLINHSNNAMAAGHYAI